MRHPAHRYDPCCPNWESTVSADVLLAFAVGCALTNPEHPKGHQISAALLSGFNAFRVLVPPFRPSQSVTCGPTLKEHSGSRTGGKFQNICKDSASGQTKEASQPFFFCHRVTESASEIVAALSDVVNTSRVLGQIIHTAVLVTQQPFGGTGVLFFLGS